MNPTSTQPEATSTDGQQDYEARFKGLQREYNKLQSTLDAKDRAVSELQGKLQAQLDALTNGETTTAQLRQELKQREEALKAACDTKQELEGKINVLEGFRAARQVLTKIKATDVVPFLDAGVFSLDTLDEAVVQQKVQTFRELMGTQKPTEDHTGATVPNVTMAANENVNIDELRAWLDNPANARHPERAARKQLYYNNLPK